MYLVLCIIAVIVIGTVIRGYLSGGKYEHFDMLLTANPIRMVHRSVFDDSPRHVKFNKNGGIMTISRHEPINAYPMRCPNFVDEQLTLGENNFCWINRV